MDTVREFRSFGWPSRLLMINQFGINLGFYMLMPYLAGYLAGPLGLAAWAVGLVLGVRNFSQQGMFIVGGTLADRLGYKPLIVAGCLLRTAGFGLLVFAHSLPAVLIASAATGFAGALFNPAVRAYLAADAGERRVEAFALFNVFYQAGILAGFGAFTFGASFNYFNDDDLFVATRTDGSVDADRWVLGIGATYAIDAWTWGIGYSRHEADINNEGGPDSDLTLQRTALTLNYALGPGINLDGEIAYTWQDVNGPDFDDSADNYDAIEFGTGIAIDF